MFSALIIDADPSARSQIEQTLTPYGFEFNFSEDAGEGVAHAREQAPDVIFLRVELPSASGFSVCNKLRRNDETKYIPLVMYAADVAEDVFEQHRNLRTRADGYLRMPLSSEQLVSTVGGIIELPAAAPGDDVEDLEVDLDEVEMVLEPAASAEPSREPLATEEPFVGEVLPAADTSSLHLAEAEADGLSDETDAAFAALTLDEPELPAPELVDAAAEPPAAHATEYEPPAFDTDGDADAQLAQLEPAAELPAATTPDATAPDDFELPAGLGLEGESTDATDATDATELEPAEADAESTDAPVAVVAAGGAPPRGRFPRGEATSASPPTSPASEPEPADDAAGEASSSEAFQAGASASGAGGNLSMRRENLQLKTEIVARDRELLRLKDELAGAKRAVLDAENRARRLEHEVGELQSKLLTSEEQALTAQEQGEAALAERRALLKREEGLKVRLDVQQKKAQNLEKELGTVQASIATTQAEHEQQLAALQEQLDGQRSEQERLRDEHGEVVGQLARVEKERAEHAEQQQVAAAETERLVVRVEELEGDLSRAKRQAEADFIAAQEQADIELEQKLATQSEEHQAQMEFQERANQERVDRLRGEWDSERERLQQESDERDERADALQLEINELNDKLQAADDVVRQKSEAIQRAQQALAVALKVLD
ncbi:MAG: response regulator [Myxococcales bacterium FL481]|nr:MAG: response regulator [Myxococcales bacterium FL481]